MSGLTDQEREDFAAFLMRMRAEGVSDKTLFSAIETTPRGAFVPRQLRSAAYRNGVFPIDCGEAIEGLDLQARTISALGVEAGHRVLEIGTGSGFTAAVLAAMAGKVTTIERYRRLVEAARERFEALGVTNVEVHQANGRDGFRQNGPYDRIVSWAAFKSVPRNSVDWLASNGVLVAPIGPPDDEQTVVRLTKIGSRFEREDLFPVRLQPLGETVAAAL